MLLPTYRTVPLRVSDGSIVQKENQMGNALTNSGRSPTPVKKLHNLPAVDV